MRRELSFSSGTETRAVVGLSKEVTLPKARTLVHKLGDKALGLGVGAKGLFVRASSGSDEDVREGLGNLAVLKRQPRATYLIGGAGLTEHKLEVLEDVRGLGWDVSLVSAWKNTKEGVQYIVVATNSAGPTFKYITREGLPDLWCRQYDKAEHTVHRAKRWNPTPHVKAGRVRLPKRVDINDTKAFPPLPSNTDEDEEQAAAMQEDASEDGDDHEHKFELSGQPRAKGVWKCDLCKEDKMRAQVRRKCVVDGCGKHACAQCCKDAMQC